MMISAIFKTFLLSLLIVAQTHFAYAQTASILPPAKTTFFDNNGNPLTSGKVYHYIPATTTAKTTWQDSGETIANTNPVILDAAGRALIYGDGVYRQIVRDRNNNIIWDQLTSSTGSGSSAPTATGDGDLVGTIKPWAGMTAPNQYAFAYGQEINRTTYATLLTAITSTQAVFCNSASPTLSGLSDTTNFWIGMSVEVSCVAAGFSTIISKTANSVTLAANANVTTNSTAIFYPWGRGNGTTTFNLPDLRGFTIAGNDNMGGVSASILTTARFGATNPNSVGAAGGAQTTSFTILTANLPPYTPTGSVTINTLNQATRHFSTAGANDTNTLSMGNSGGTLVTPNGVPFASGTGTLNGVAQGGTSTAIVTTTIQPTKTANYIIKITPDTNSATASGVTSLGSMTGDIACGSGLLCTGNNIDIAAGAASLNVGTTPIASGTNTRVLYNNAGVLGEYSSVPVALGGTGGTAASGTLLDNITAFASTGFLTRTGAGTYAFQSTTNGITNANLVQAAGATLKGNPTAALANVSDFTIQGLTDIVTPDTTLDFMPIYNHLTGTIQRTTAAQIASALGGGVTSVSGANGAGTSTGAAITGIGTVVNVVPVFGGRLTLTSATPITTTDVTGATAIYYATSGNRYITLYDGTNLLATDFAAELSVTLGANWTTNTNYDWFAGLDGATLRLCSGPAWSSDTARGTGAGTTELTLVGGVYLNANTMTCRYANGSTFSCTAQRCSYLGSARTVAAGQLEDSLTKRYLFNNYNQVQRSMLRQEPTASWNYSTASYQQVRGSADNQLSYFSGNPGSPLYAFAQCIPLNSTSTLRIVYCGIGLDSTTVNSRSLGDFARIGDATVVSSAPRAIYNGFTSLGKHDVVWLEKGAGSDTQTWFGVSGSDYQSGISGYVVQ